MLKFSTSSGRRLLPAHACGLMLLFGGLTLQIETAFAADRIDVYTEQSFPMNYTRNGTDNEPVIGPATDLMVAVLEEAGLDYHINMGPWSRAMQAIDSTKNVIVYSMTRSAEREDLYHWIGEIMPTVYYLYGLKDNSNIRPKTEKEAAAFRIGVLRGDVTHSYLTEQGYKQLALVREVSRSVDMLERGRIDLFPFNKFHIGIFLNDEGRDHDDYIGVVELAGISAGMYMALSKSTDQHIVDRLQSAYAAVNASGQYDVLIRPLVLTGEKYSVELSR